MSVEISGFEEFIANEVYVAEDYLGGYWEKHRTNAVLLPKRYRLPDEDRIFGFIRQKAENLGNVRKLSQVRDKNQGRAFDTVERVLLEIPYEMMYSLLNGGEEFRDALGWDLYLPKSGSMEKMDLTFGVLPKRINYQMFTDAAQFHNMLLDDELYKKGMGELWTLSILLTPKGALPSQADVETLLRHRTVESETLWIDDPGYDISELINIIRQVYRAFNLKEKIRKIPDASDYMLEEIAIDILSGFL